MRRNIFTHKCFYTLSTAGCMCVSTACGDCGSSSTFCRAHFGSSLQSLPGPWVRIALCSRDNLLLLILASFHSVLYDICWLDCSVGLAQANVMITAATSHGHAAIIQYCPFLRIFFLSKVVWEFVQAAVNPQQPQLYIVFAHANACFRLVGCLVRLKEMDLILSPMSTLVVTYHITVHLVASHCGQYC